MRIAVVTALFGPALAASLTPAIPPPDNNRAKSAIGVTHVAGTYHLTQQDFLNEGADQILRLGAKVIKLYLAAPAKNYPYNSDWPTTRSLVEIAETSYYRKLFSRPFQTYILTTYRPGISDHYWTRGISSAEKDAECRAIRDLAEHLLTSYRGTGKTFVLQHWEGDWAIRGEFDPRKDPPETAVKGMVGWLEARQRGVELARKKVGEKGVRVLHAAEVNLVRQSMEKGAPGVTTRVLPRVRLDLVSYSAWDTQEDPGALRRALDFIAKNSRLPRRRAVYIGEFGLPENGRSPEDVLHVTRGVVDTALDWGCPYVVYWQLYCNEARRTPVRENKDVRGFWLIRPDGSESAAWGYLRNLLSP